MSVWVKNLRHAMEQKEVCLLYGNVRDRYINAEDGRIYSSLDDLLKVEAGKLSWKFNEIISYDPVAQEKHLHLAPQATSHPQGQPQPEPQPAPPPGGELGRTGPSRESQARPPAERVLARWAKELSRKDKNTLAILFYLDKVVAYRSGYTDEEKDLLLRLEKLMAKITPNNRLVMVALQDSMVPVELYTFAPRMRLLSVPLPDQADRLAYLSFKLGTDYPNLELMANLTEGLFLQDLENLCQELGERLEHRDDREIRMLVNKYRLGEQQDYWGSLGIEKLFSGARWFTQKEKVTGQNYAVSRVVDVLYVARAGLSGVGIGAAAKPKGILFFAGPTGVGKTLLAKKLARFLFGTEEAFIRFDMSEYKEDHTISRLIGSPPGYVGHEQGGMLTNSVRERPFSVILFDEVEKAHPKILDIFLQILDDGRLTDSRGQTVFFTETVIIFTSNLGTRTTSSQGHPIEERERLDGIRHDSQLSEEGRQEAIAQHFVTAVEHFFMYEISRPELLNRIGRNIIPFNYVNEKGVQKRIIEAHLEFFQEEFNANNQKRGYRVEFLPTIADYLVNKHEKRIAEFGARVILQAVDEEIKIPLAKAILTAEHHQKTGLVFHLADKNNKVIVT